MAEGAFYERRFRLGVCGDDAAAGAAAGFTLQKP
jgi:hypothetical protein